VSYIKSKSFKIVSRFYVIYGDDEPIYVGYTNRTVKQRFKEHQKDKDFSEYDNVEVKELIDEKLSFDFTWDYEQTCRNADEVSLREGQLVQQYGTQDSEFQKADGGGQTWSAEKWFIKSNKDNPKFKGLSGAEIKKLLKEEKITVDWLNGFTKNMVPAEEIWLHNFVTDMQPVEEIWLKGFVNRMKPIEEVWISNFVNHMYPIEEVWLSNFTGHMQLTEEIWLSSFVNRMKPIEEVWLNNFVNNMKPDEDIWLSSFVSSMRSAEEVWLNSFVDNIKPIEKVWLNGFVKNMRQIEETWLSNFAGDMRPTEKRWLNDFVGDMKQKNKKVLTNPTDSTMI